MIDIDQLIEEDEQVAASKDTTPAATGEGVNDTVIPDNDSVTPTDQDNNSSDESDDDVGESDIVVDEDAKAYFDFLKVENVLDVPEDFVFKGNSESIQEALALTKKNLTTKVAQQIWQTLPDDFKPLLEYGLNGGTDLQKFLDIAKSSDVETLELTDDISRKAVIKSYYKVLNPKLDDAQIDKRISRLSEIADLEEEALDALEYLKTHKEEQKAALILEAQAEQQRQIDQAKKEIDTYVKLIDESKDLEVNQKNRLKTFLLSPDNNTTGFEASLDAVYANPQHKIQLAAILADYDPRIGFNFDRIQKKAQNKATQSLKELINSKLDTKSQVKGVQKPSKEDFSWDEFYS